MSHETCARVLLCIFAAAAILALPATAAADVDSDGQRCVGLDCGSPVSPDYVPEAHGAVPTAAGIDQLLAQGESGFYEIPAPVYQGDVQPRAVVYLSMPGQFGRMPASVRNLRLVTEFELIGGSKVNTAALVMIDRGMRLVIPTRARATAGRRPRAKAAQLLIDALNECGDRNFCVWYDDNWDSNHFTMEGPVYAGTGWHNWCCATNNNADSMVNRRDGDTLLANLYNGDGSRYCASQQSADSTFSNNSFHDVASSVALLGSGTDRC